MTKPITDSVAQPSIPNPPSTSIHDMYDVEQASAADAAGIASLGRDVFTTTFGNSMPPKDLQYYLDEAYSTAAIERDIATPNKHFWVAKSRDPSEKLTDPSRVVGFVQMTEGTTEDFLGVDDKLVELHRLYLRSESQGTGLAKKLIENMEDWSRSKGYERMWLGVWDRNEKAKRFYRKFGYTKRGIHSFKMGDTLDIDEVWSKSIV